MLCIGGGEISLGGGVSQIGGVSSIVVGVSEITGEFSALGRDESEIDGIVSIVVPGVTSWLHCVWESGDIGMEATRDGNELSSVAISEISEDRRSLSVFSFNLFLFAAMISISLGSTYSSLEGLGVSSCGVTS